MRSPHLHAAHAFWRSHLTKGATVIDATCGNGHDTLILADLALTESSGALHAIDIQPQAIAATHARIENHPCRHRICLHLASHATLPAKELDLVVYNLGYLPGSSKLLTTNTLTTICSLDLAFSRLIKGGALCITTYSGHPQGREEQLAVLEWARRHSNVEHKKWDSYLLHPQLVIIYNY